MKRVGLFLVVALVAMMAVPTAMAAETYSLFDDAELISPGNASPQAVQIRSDATPGWGGIDFVIPAGTTFADLTTLSTDYMFEADDSCGAGSPRFQINVDSGSGVTGNIFVYIGPPPGYSTCPPSQWVNTGDLLEGTNPVDTSQVGGTFYDPYATALANYGSYTVTGIQVVVDSGWAFLDGEQTVVIDNTNITVGFHTYDPTTGDLVQDLRGDTVDLVTNASAERTLLATLDRAQNYLDSGRPFLAYLTMIHFAMQVDRFENAGRITPSAAGQLSEQAVQITRSLF